MFRGRSIDIVYMLYTDSKEERRYYEEKIDIVSAVLMFDSRVPPEIE